ncbi:hypothetical protein PENTCL1PPCAC_18222, partial [Pristionchus entomophagus]
GIVVGFKEIKSGKFFFVNTPHGVAVLYPRALDKERGLGLGAYVKVLTRPCRSVPSISRNEEVESFEWNDQPEDHEVDVKWDRVMVKCNVYFGGQDNGWYFFDNPYLGRLAMKETGSKVEKNVKVDCMYRVVCRKVKEEDGLSSVREPIVWVVKDIDFADRTVHTGRWFEGVVTQRTHDFALITSPNLPIDVMLYDWNKRSHTESEGLLGRWVRFQIDIRHVNDHGLRYRAVNNITMIDSLYKTRVIGTYTELLIRCEWNGKMEDSGALMESEIGPIRDNLRIIDTRNENANIEFEVWVVKHFRNNHSARWKLSIHDNEPIKINKGKSMERQRGNRVDYKSAVVTSMQPQYPEYPIKLKKDRRVIDIMTQFMLSDSVYDAFRKNDRESAKKVMKILERYGKK